MHFFGDAIIFYFLMMGFRMRYPKIWLLGVSIFETEGIWETTGTRKTLRPSPEAGPGTFLGDGPHPRAEGAPSAPGRGTPRCHTNRPHSCPAWPRLARSRRPIASARPPPTGLETPQFICFAGRFLAKAPTSRGTYVKSIRVTFSC